MRSTDPYVKLAKQTQRMTLPASREMAPIVVSSCVVGRDASWTCEMGSQDQQGKSSDARIPPTRPTMTPSPLPQLLRSA